MVKLESEYYVQTRHDYQPYEFAIGGDYPSPPALHHTIYPCNAQATPHQPPLQTKQVILAGSSRLTMLISL